MEYLDGRSLKELILARGPAPVQVAIDYGRQILSALRFAHRNGIVHRDIKPHNVLVDSEGRVKVTDFGIARAGAHADDRGRLDRRHGAVPLAGAGARRAVDQRSDLYSLGVVLYELLTGHAAVHRRHSVEIAMKHISDDAAAARARRREVPARLDLVVHARAREGPGGAVPDRRRDGPPTSSASARGASRSPARRRRRRRRCSRGAAFADSAVDDARPGRRGDATVRDRRRRLARRTYFDYEEPRRRRRPSGRG